MSSTVSIVIPAYNESELIADTVGVLQDMPQTMEIIVINDGSTDNTGELAQKAGARVWTNKRNLGKGASLNIGAALTKGDIIVFLDGDLGASAREAVKLITPIIEDTADCTIGLLPKPTVPGGFGLVKKLALWGVRHYGGKEILAVLSGQRAFNRKALEAIFPVAGGYGAEVAATISLLRKGFRIKEIEVAMKHRETGRNLKGFLHRGRQFQHILRVLAGEALK